MALKSSRMEQNSKLNSIESQPILACDYIFVVILINAIRLSIKDNATSRLCFILYNRAFNEECVKLRSIFSCLDYPRSLIDSVISNFESQNPSTSIAERNTDESNIVRITLPFKDQVSANAVRRQLRDLSHKIGPTLQPVFISKKLEHNLKPKEARPSIVNQQCVVYHFVCDLCDADYVGYTARHLFQRVAEHKNSAIGKHFHDAHGRSDFLNESHFKIIRKCRGKFDCLVFEMLYIKKFKPNLNVQADSIRAKLFV